LAQGKEKPSAQSFLLVGSDGKHANWNGN